MNAAVLAALRKIEAGRTDLETALREVPQGAERRLAFKGCKSFGIGDTELARLAGISRSRVKQLTREGS